MSISLSKIYGLLFFTHCCHLHICTNEHINITCWVCSGLPTCICFWADQLKLDNQSRVSSFGKINSPFLRNYYLLETLHLGVGPIRLISPSLLGFWLLEWFRLSLGNDVAQISQCSFPIVARKYSLTGDALVLKPLLLPCSINTRCVVDASVGAGHPWSVLLCVLTSCGFL